MNLNSAILCVLLLTLQSPLFGAVGKKADPPAESEAGETDFRTDRGGVLLTFDDRNFSDWIAALPLFEEYGVKVTFFISGAIDKSALDAAHRLQSRGHAIGAHGLRHRKAVDYSKENSAEDYVITEILPQLAAFRAAGIKVTSFAYPNSQSSEVTDRALLKKFRHLRTGGGLADGDRISVQDRFYVPAGKTRVHGSLTGKGIDYAPSMDDRTFEQIDEALVRAADKNEVLVLYAHGIAVSKRGHHITPKALEHIFQKAHELNLPFYTFDQLP
jgi:peptidoglycan-N-acetylglucosamine deacetylase